MAFVIQRDFHPEFPPSAGTLMCWIVASSTVSVTIYADDVPLSAFPRTYLAVRIAEEVN